MQDQSCVAVTSSPSRVEDVAASGYTADRATFRQKKTGRRSDLN
jgi:hypothetical protein